MDKSRLASIFGMSIDALEKQVGCQTLSSAQTSGNGASAGSSVYTALIPLDKWRVISMGFFCVANGATTVAEKITFGIWGDAAIFGSLSMDVTADKQWAAGDFYEKSSSQGIQMVNSVFGNGGNHTYAAEGSKLGVWMTEPEFLVTLKSHVANSTMTFTPYYIIEVA